MNPGNINNGNAIVIEGLNKSFNGTQVLKDISLKLSMDENLVILGRSGMGKSVLIKCIAGLEHYDSGSVKVLENEIGEMNEFDLNELRKNIGFLFQGAALYDSMTVEENLLFPLKRNAPQMSDDKADRIINDVLDSVGLLNARYKMPQELSGGMKKRAGLARTLVMKPKIILYDEPTTGLDPFTSVGISDLIVEIKNKYCTASILVTHDMKCARSTADRIIVLEEGQILAEGSYTELQKLEHPIIRGFFN